MGIMANTLSCEKLIYKIYLLRDLEYHFSSINISPEFLKLDLKINTDKYIGMCVQIGEFPFFII